MFGFLLSVAGIALSLFAVNKGFKHASKLKEETEYEEIHNLSKEDIEYFDFLTSNDSKEIFKETHNLFKQAIQQALENSDFGNLGHTTTLSKTIYHFNVQLTISPTDILWEVFDLAQNVTLKSHHRFTIRFDRSRKMVTYDELRINHGNTYNSSSILDFQNSDALPFNFHETMELLNDAGWNKVNSNSYDIPKETSLQTDLKPFADEISNIIKNNENSIDTDVLKLFSDILSIINNLISDEQAISYYNDKNNFEFKHELKRLVEHELSKILTIYLELDENGKNDVKDMVIQSLEKAYTQLIKKVNAFQNEKITELKQTHLVMEERYEA